MIASYLRDNWHNLAFETGASIATALELSEMTVIRFIRQIGFANLKDFKEALKTSEAPDAAMATLAALGQAQLPFLANQAMDERLQTEIQAIAEAYRLTTLPRWTICTNQLAESESISVIGFHAAKGLGLDFATRLQYARPHVRGFLDHSALCTEILDLAGRNHCLVLIDTFPYSRKSILLAQKARQHGTPLIVISDNLTNWGYDYTEMVLQAPTSLPDSQTSSASLAVILSLLTSSTAKKIGAAATERARFMRQMEGHFDEVRRPQPQRGQQRDFDFTS